MEKISAFELSKILNIFEASLKIKDSDQNKIALRSTKKERELLFEKLKKLFNDIKLNFDE